MDAQQRKMAEELLFADKKQPSFAKQLYLGKFDDKLIFPFPEVDPAEKAITDKFLVQVQEFSDKQIDADSIDRQSSIPQGVIDGLGHLGVLGMTIPAEYGGLGMTQYAYCKTVELLARKCGSTALFVNAHQSVGLKALLLFGTAEQKKRWLPPLARGDLLGAFSLTEPNAGSDAAGIETRAVFDRAKNVWRINGKKQWTTNGAIAGVLTVMARTQIETPQGLQDKITAFLVTPDMPGFKVTAAALEKVGMRGSKTANLAFENLEVPAANVLGPLGGGLKVCLTVLDYGRTTFGATCTGSAKYLIERAISHACKRHQFNRPLGSFALVKKKIALMSAYLYAMESATLLTASFVDRKVEDFMLESAMLKVFCSDSLWTIVYETMQIFGGRSFFTDEPFERMMRDARLNMIGEGSNEVMRAFIGAVGMRDVGMTLKATLDDLKSPIRRFSSLMSSLSGWFAHLSTPVVPVRSQSMQAEAVALARRVRTFGIAVPKLLIQYREGIIENQLQLDRIATAAMALYTASAVLSRIDTELYRLGSTAHGHMPELLSRDQACAKLYCQLAFDNFDNALAGIKHNIDIDIESLSDKITNIPPHGSYTHAK
jgi:acyl-CoA dehydrogenase family protein 9